MKKNTLILLTLVLIGAGFIGYYLYQKNQLPTDTKGGEIVTAGVILPLTGEGAVWGKNAKEGMQLALEEVNADKTLGFTLNLKYEDSQTNAKQAVSAFQKLINQYDIQWSIVDMISSNVLAIAPIANEKEVVILSPGASSPAITNAGEYVFRNWPSDAIQGVVNAQFAINELKWAKSAVVYVLNAYGEGLKDSFSNEFKKLGGTVVLSEGIKQGASDSRNQLIKISDLIKSENLDGVYLAIYPTEHPVILRQSAELSIKTNFLATETFDDQSIYSLDVADGVIFSLPAPPDASSLAVQNFNTQFQKKFGKSPGITADAAYDAIKILTLCTKESGYVGKNIAGCLLRIKSYDGASGSTTFDKNGDVLKPFLFKLVKDGLVSNWSDDIYQPKID